MCSSETSVGFQQTTWRYIPEDSSFYSLLIVWCSLLICAVPVASFVQPLVANGTPGAQVCQSCWLHMLQPFFSLLSVTAVRALGLRDFGPKPIAFRRRIFPWLKCSLSVGTTTPLQQWTQSGDRVISSLGLVPCLQWEPLSLAEADRTASDTEKTSSVMDLYHQFDWVADFCHACCSNGAKCAVGTWRPG
jgi:hypothetical protein